MADVILDAGEQVTVECNNLNVKGHDFLLDSPPRRKPNGPQFRRALVHDTNDGLTINYSGDYPGGVIINGLAELRPLGQPGGGRLAVPNLVIRAGTPGSSKGSPGSRAPEPLDVDIPGLRHTR
jgi:hypothetical protein